MVHGFVLPFFFVDCFLHNHQKTHILPKKIRIPCEYLLVSAQVRSPNVSIWNLNFDSNPFHNPKFLDAKGKKNKLPKSIPS